MPSLKELNEILKHKTPEEYAKELLEKYEEEERSRYTWKDEDGNSYYDISIRVRCKGKLIDRIIERLKKGYPFMSIGYKKLPLESIESEKQFYDVIQQGIDNMSGSTRNEEDMKAYIDAVNGLD